jgi:NAD-dependent DNA ligase
VLSIMASERVSKILRAKTDLTDDQIAGMSDAQGWQVIYSLPSRRDRKARLVDQVCFSGFSESEKERLSALATAHGMNVTASVTKNLTYLVTGPNAGPMKIKKAMEQDVTLMSEQQFIVLMRTGEISSS